MFAHPGQSMPALFSPMFAEAGITPTASTLDVPSVNVPASEQAFYPTQDIVYNCDRQTITSHCANYPSGQNGASGSALDSPISFRERHSLLHGVYNSFLDPCEISGKELENVSRKAGLSMEEVLSWFKDEKSRRMEILACQFVQPQQPAQQLSMSPAATTTSGLNRTVAWSMSEFGSLLPGTPMNLDQNFALFSPSTPSDHPMPSPRGAKRGRPPKNKSFTPSVSPSPKAKRQKSSAKYPCPDCGKWFAVDRWSEHVKRSHFPDHVWECQNLNGRTGKPCMEKIFFRQDNFVTHLKGEHGCPDDEISGLKIAFKFPVVSFFHEKCGFIGCGNTFMARDESMEHIKDHFRQFAQNSNVPKDLGASQWTHNCATKHTLKRGVHYGVKQGVDNKNSENQDDNDENGSDDPNSSNQSQSHSESSPDDGLPPGEEDKCSHPAGFESSQDSNSTKYAQHPATTPRTDPGLETNLRSSENCFGLENFVLPFTIRRRLGSGGHGLVDEVCTTSSPETFARKSVLRKDEICETSAQMHHLKNELSILKELSHPHLMKLIGAYADAKYSHIIMSPVADQNLAQYLQSPQSAQQPQLLRWMGCLSSAIDYLHSRGIQHLDVKPQNILLTGENVLLTDFGTAKSLNSWPLDLRTLAVTPVYCAPETMLHGRQEYGSDIFSLGCVFSEMITRHSGRSILEFEEFRLKDGNNAFHSTISEVVAWIALLSRTISSDRTPSHLAEHQTQFREKILQMLAELSSDRPKANDLQSCFMDMDCHQCKSYTAGLSATPRSAIPEHESSFTSGSIPFGGSDSNLTVDIAPVPTCATNISKTTEIGHMEDSFPQNPAPPTSPASPLSQPLENTNLLTQISPAGQPSHSGNLSSKTASLEDAEKDDHACRECGKVFSDMEAHMLTHQTERLQKCPTCDSTFIDALDYHEHLNKCILGETHERCEGSPVNILTAKKAKTNPMLPKLPNMIRPNNSQSVTIDGVDIFSTSLFLGEHVRYDESSIGQSVDPSSSLVDLSTFGDPWTHGNEFAIDQEGMDYDDRSNMPCEPERVLAGLYTPEPRIVFNPYEHVGDQQSPESVANYYIIPSRPVNSQDIYENPWTPIDSRISAFPPGFVAFAPSPGPSPEVYTEYSSTEHSKSSRLNKSRTSKQIHSSTKGKENGWEHVVVAKGGLHHVSEASEAGSTRRLGTRTALLDPVLKEKARRIRRGAACWRCWVLKVPCSEGEPCTRCRKLSSPSPSPRADQQLCWRSGFKEYEPTFFPEFMHAHLRKSKIEDPIVEHTTRFLDTTINVEVSTGSIFRPMRLETNFFAPSTNELLQQSILTPAEVDHGPELVRFSSAPIGILGLSVSDMKKKCNKHIEDMLSNSKYAAQTTAGDESELPNQILEIVLEYSAKKEVLLLRNALKLHAIHYFMGSLITFSESSAREILSIHPLFSPPQSYLSSRLLNRQLKYVMHKLHREITISVLEDLERSLRSRTKDSWGPSFCTILILCLCIEKLQSAADTMVMCEIQEKGASAFFTRDQSLDACEMLENYPFKQSTKLFHDIYRTHKAGSVGGGQRGEKSFNPLKMAAGEENMGLDKPTEGMAKTIYGVVAEKWCEISELSERSIMINLGQTAFALQDIMVNNAGRLAAIFLKSFFPDFVGKSNGV